MKLGASPGKVAVVVILFAVGLYSLFWPSGDEVPSSSTGSASRPPAPNIARNPAAVPGALPTGEPEPETARQRSSARASVREFKPVLKSSRPDQRIDTTNVDPTLQLPLLARLKGVPILGGQRNLFALNSEPTGPRQPDPPKIIPKPRVDWTKRPVQGPMEKPPPPPPPAPPVKPAPPPITFKYFGYVGGAKPGAKKAFFLDGEEILVGGEGDVLKKRYKVIRVGLNSVVVRDLQFEGDQTLPLEEGPAL